MDAARLEVAADPTCLDVDDAARSERDRRFRYACRGDRLVEADRGTHDLRDLGVPEDVLFGKRLLDQQEIELVERREGLDVIDGICSIGVDLKRDVAEVLAHRSHRIEVVSGLDLELDPPVALLEVALDRSQQLDGSLVNADGDTTVDLVANGAEKRTERDVARVQRRVDDRHLD